MAPNDEDMVDVLDELEELLGEYDEGLGSAPHNKESNKETTRKPSNDDVDKPPLDLGIDQDVKQKKARKLAPKLDEALMLSDRGISKLQRISKSKLKFKGKGYEFPDIAWLLGTYQVWLHELYPRAKFEDGLEMIEKLGHTKKMQQYRSGWINENKHMDHGDLANTAQTLVDPPTPPPESNLTPEIENIELEAGSNDPLESQPLQVPPEEDEFDQLFAENAARNSSTSVSKPNDHVEYEDEDDFADEDDIMRELNL